MTVTRLTKEFFEGHTTDVAQSLLGVMLARRIGRHTLRAIIVEVEAYLAADDAASHSAIGPGRRNASMFASPGSLYVYSIHARHCMNVVTEQRGAGAAVLIRAVEPWQGVEQMWGARSMQPMMQPTITQRRRLTQGPGRLCEALSVDRALDGTDLCSSSEVWLEEPPHTVRGIPICVTASPRIGISKATQLPLRWFLDGNHFVSGLARDHKAGRTWCYRDLIH